jgi:branched-chain amino acid aminotransferase
MANIDWNNLGFGYHTTNCNARCYYKDGKWGNVEYSESEEITMHMAATSLHYGQEVFEGLKAFMGKDGKTRIFRMDENAKRMQKSAEGILMEKVPVDIFKEAVLGAVQRNIEFVPPYGLGGALYIRPLLIGTGPQVGVKPSTEYLFIVFVTPVGAYFKSGFKPTNVAILNSYDRAAPNGTGHLKVGGNYAAGMSAGLYASDKGYSTVLYLDSKEKKYIDECGPANFFAIKDNTYITPKSKSILASITNDSLLKLAEGMGMKTERRQVEESELATFEEAGACGTAAAISPISYIDDVENDKRYEFSMDGEAGVVTTELYRQLTGIQCGDIEDKYGWVTIV